MNLKKVKRILAAALAVLLAVPTVSYGGVSEVHAEEASDNTADAAEGGEYTLVTEIESIDNAIPKKRASLGSIILESSKSEDFGSLIICIVIPKNFINKLYILGSFKFTLHLFDEVL